MFQKNEKLFRKMGIEQYNFYFKEERGKYACLYYLSGYKSYMNKYGLKNIFTNYSDWRNYVVAKHSTMTKDELVDFSQYLNQMLRTENSMNSMLIIIITALLTVLMEDTVHDLADMISGNLSSLLAVLIYIIMLAVAISILFLAIEYTYPIINKRAEKNFISDYKEIIDEIIKEKDQVEMTESNSDDFENPV